MNDDLDDVVAPKEPADATAAPGGISPGAFLTPPLQLTAYEFDRPMEKGMTGPMSIAAFASDGKEYRVILKLRDPGTPVGRGDNGHFRGTSLAVELICGVLARALGLRVPDYAVVHVGAVFANGVRDDVVHRRLVDNIGPNFGTVMMKGYGDWHPSCTRQSEELRDAIEGVFIFDSVVFNGDRRTDNPNLLWDGFDDVRMIDHGLALLAHGWSDQVIAGSPLLPDPRVQEHCGYRYLKGLARTYEALLATWAAVMSPGVWRALRSYIPPEWEANRGDLDRIFRFLEERPQRFADLSLNLRRIAR